jgi:hypothetical protein
MRPLSTAAVALLVLALTGPSAEAGGKGGKVYKTPQEAFNALKEAAKNEDWKTICTIVTDDSLSMMAAGGAVGAVFMKGFIEAFAKDKKDDKVEKIVKDLNAALNKHGLTDEVLKGFNLKALFDPKTGKDPAATKKILAGVAGKIKDRCAFLADLFKALPSEGGSPLAPLATAQVKNIKVDGDTAKGVLITSKGGKEKEQPIEFRKVGGSWKVEMPMGGPSAPGAGAAPPPAPGRSSALPALDRRQAALAGERQG